MQASYTRCYKDDAQGYITLDRTGMAKPRTINLTGAAAMSQEELDFYGKIFADALGNMTDKQLKQVAKFNPRKIK